MGVSWNKTGIYYYGASLHEHRPLMAPYLLQWEAMHICRARQCHDYDLFGIAPPDASEHHLRGVTDFKRKFGGRTVTYPPERTLRLRPVASAMLAMKRRLWR
jgi:lipid II:glycine glycyltransferase (peptidoglycan interpeptide bridge formation enzyme)